MPKRLGNGFFGMSKDELENLCRVKGLNDIETEIILRIYWQKQSINFIADTLDFKKYGKEHAYYSARSINYFHKAAFMKLLKWLFLR